METKFMRFKTYLLTSKSFLLETYKQRYQHIPGVFLCGEATEHQNTPIGHVGYQIGKVDLKPGMIIVQCQDRMLNLKEYDQDELRGDLEKLKKLVEAKMRPNPKNITYLREMLTSLPLHTPEHEECARKLFKEEHLFDYIIENHLDSPTSPGQKIWNITAQIANNGRDTKFGFAPNAPTRWNNILRNLGYIGVVLEDHVLFLSKSKLEVLVNV